MISTDASDRLELMLVSAVTTVLAIRGFLHLTGYPQIGGGGLHIAHLLWGGLGLTLALIVTLSALGRRPFTVAALIGGIGLGFFIDEIGKFVTADNDYFYKPAIALMYVVFLALVVVMRIVRSRPIGGDAALANALTMIADSYHRGMDPAAQQSILAMLDVAATDHELAPRLRQAVLEAPLIPLADRNPYDRTRAALAARYAAFAATRTFRRITLIGAVAYIVTVLPTLAAVAVYRDAGIMIEGGGIRLVLTFATSLLIVVLTLIATLHLVRRDTLGGFRWLRTATVASLVLSQPIAFWYEEFGALPSFTISLLLYTALNYGVHREEELASGVTPEPLTAAR